MRRSPLLLFSVALALLACDHGAPSPIADTTTAEATVQSAVPDQPSPHFRNVDTPTSYVGDASCASCHAREASAYRRHAMARSFHRWTRAGHLETSLDAPLHHAPTGFSYTVVDSGGWLYQVEFLVGPDGGRIHQLRRRMDYVMGSGAVALTYFTEENGRLFQLPLTWYRSHGWDFSPGYEINSARFDRVLPDRCISCHSSYPRPLPHLEGKFAELRSGIGCERCHGPGGLHVQERRSAARRDGAFDHSIVNPARLPLERRLDVCEQCHVHTAVTVPREGKDDFSYLPSQPLRDQYAFFKVAGDIDIVSHADRLRQSRCFIAARSTARPLECATCHDPHAPAPAAASRNTPCQGCHSTALLQQRLARSPALADHAPASNCVSCHMPRVQVRAAVHGAFTDHWIRVASRQTAPTTPRPYGVGVIEPYYERDRRGPDAAVYQGMGEILYATLANSGRVLADAAAALDVALASDTTRGDAEFLLGVAEQQLGHPDDAIRDLERAVRADSNRPDRLRALAQAYERAGRAPAEIDHLYGRALALQPALAWIRADYADYLQSQERLGEATKAYQAALTEQPSLAVARFNLGAVLAGEGKLRESSAAFQAAVHLDPSLAQALSPLFEIRTSAGAVRSIHPLGSPLASLPVRERDPRAASLAVPAEPGPPALRFNNVPPHGVVQILKPDGTLLRSLPTGDGFALRWDLLLDTGSPVAAGLYRARVLGRGPGGRAAAPQSFYFGVVREHGG